MRANNSSRCLQHHQFWRRKQILPRIHLTDFLFHAVKQYIGMIDMQVGPHGCFCPPTPSQLPSFAQKSTESDAQSDINLLLQTLEPHERSPNHYEPWLAFDRQGPQSFTFPWYPRLEHHFRPDLPRELLPQALHLAYLCMRSPLLPRCTGNTRATAGIHMSCNPAWDGMWDGSLS
jgi:hypothetical protein